MSLEQICVSEFTVPLSGFQSLFEVSIAGILSIGFFEQLRNASRNASDKITEDFFQKFNIDDYSGKTKNLILRARVELEHEGIIYFDNSEKCYRMGRWISLLTSSSLALLLLYSGLFPHTQISFKEAFQIVAFQALPIVYLQCGLGIYFLWVRRRLGKMSAKSGHDILKYEDAYANLKNEDSELLFELAIQASERERTEADSPESDE